VGWYQALTKAVLSRYCADMSRYRINVLGLLTIDGLFCAFIISILANASLPGWAIWIPFSAIGLALLLELKAKCPQCGKSPFRSYKKPTEPPGRYAPYRTSKRDWPEKVCSECGYDLTQPSA
jgi:hypothetical protein